jgi:hypothetical protein
MTPFELMSDVLVRNGEILKMTLADFSEQEMLARPVPGANHAAWQLGHLIGSAAYMLKEVAPAGVVPEAAAQLGAKYEGKTANIDDAAFFANKSELLEVFAQIHDAISTWVKTLTPNDLNRPTPARMADYAPTVGHVVLMIPGHIMMHVGQMQVIRRKLGKPLLF